MPQTLDWMCERYQEWTESVPLPYETRVKASDRLADFLLRYDDREAQKRLWLFIRRGIVEHSANKYPHIS